MERKGGGRMRRSGIGGGAQVGLMRLIREKTKGGPRRGHRAGMRVRTNYEEHWRGPSERKLSRLN